jgi:hypothetical protein
MLGRLLFRITDRLKAVLTISLYVLVNTISDNLAGLLINELLRALDRNNIRANQVNDQNVGVHGIRYCNGLMTFS